MQPHWHELLRFGLPGPASGPAIPDTLPFWSPIYQSLLTYTQFKGDLQEFPASQLSQADAANLFELNRWLSKSAAGISLARSPSTNMRRSSPRVSQKWVRLITGGLIAQNFVDAR
ncbi:hypothetical protein CT19425_U600029 [Cupriavidus taiwanensis]|uniref:Uncharacterized protein n=1 Tax=Cupriavidus taiwanensis TaxID=164546 RepID=A0A375IB96_9BURK|nr:hypothetical protein CT19425_U600029 [Cupriavidus taiwanensis]